MDILSNPENTLDEENEKCYGANKFIIEGKIEGRRVPGGGRHSWLKNLGDWYACSNNQIIQIGGF